MDKLTVIIPTRDRPEDLRFALISLFEQTRLPDQLVLVDQSKDNSSQITLESVTPLNNVVDIIYLYDQKISGLVEAKKKGVFVSTGELICFIEDDVELESDYLKEIERAFLTNPQIIGCCGVVTNPPKRSKIYSIFFNIFHAGIFKDIRASYHGEIKNWNNYLIPSDKLSGGISAWRRNVFNNVPFDDINGFHMFEDIDFSTRVARYYGGHLFINLKVRLAHYHSPVNRDGVGMRHRRKIRECFIFYRKRKNWKWATSSFVLVLFGMLIDALCQSYSNKSFRPIQGYFLGFFDGIKQKIILLNE
jgi:GT2 family glycosyltransferase